MVVRPGLVIEASDCNINTCTTQGGVAQGLEQRLHKATGSSKTLDF